MRRRQVFFVTLAAVFAGAYTFAQVGRGTSEWLTAQADAQRTSWIRTDTRISLETMAKPGFDLQWTSKLDNQARQLNGLTQGVTANGVTLFVPMSIVSGSSNNVYAIDNDTGYVVWQRKFDAALPAATAQCPGGISAAATRLINITPPAITPPAPGRAGGGRAGYRSLVGEPGQGVPVEPRAGGPGRVGAPPAGPGAGPQAGAAGAGRTAGPAGAPPPAPGAPAPAAPAVPSPGPAAPPAPGVAGVPPPGAQPGAAQRGRGAGTAGIPGAPNGGGPAGGFGRPSGVVYAISSDGVLHVLGLPSGKDLQRPAQFLPANARWSDAIAANAMLYATTTGNCGGAPSAVWAMDLESESKPVVSWRTNGGYVVGPVAFTTDGTLLAAIGAGQTTGDGKANAIVALDPKTLQLKDWFTQPTAEFVTGPMVFQHNNKDIVAAGTRDGRIILLDAGSLGGANHGTPLHASVPVTGAGGTIAGALATWQEATFTPAAPAPAPAPAAGAPPAPPVPPTVTLGSRWILVPVAGRIAATQATNGAISTGAVVGFKLNDTAGALSIQPVWTSHNLSAPATPIIVNGVVFTLATGRPAQASAAGTPAVLYAYDGVSGKALWNSAKAMARFASPGSFWSAMGQTYVGTHDGTLYAFGFLDERR